MPADLGSASFGLASEVEVGFKNVSRYVLVESEGGGMIISVLLGGTVEGVAGATGGLVDGNGAGDDDEDGGGAGLSKSEAASAGKTARPRLGFELGQLFKYEAIYPTCEMEILYWGEVETYRSSSSLRRSKSGSQMHSTTGNPGLR